MAIEPKLFPASMTPKPSERSPSLSPHIERTEVQKIQDAFRVFSSKISELSDRPSQMINIQRCEAVFCELYQTRDAFMASLKPRDLHAFTGAAIEAYGQEAAIDQRINYGFSTLAEQLEVRRFDANNPDFKEALVELVEKIQNIPLLTEAHLATCSANGIDVCGHLQRALMKFAQ